jgi:hypothetical protein
MASKSRSSPWKLIGKYIYKLFPAFLSWLSLDIYLENRIKNKEKTSFEFKNLIPADKNYVLTSGFSILYFLYSLMIFFLLLFSFFPLFSLFFIFALFSLFFNYEFLDIVLGAFLLYALFTGMKNFLLN